MTQRGLGFEIFKIEVAPMCNIMATISRQSLPSQFKKTFLLYQISRMGAICSPRAIMFIKKHFESMLDYYIGERIVAIHNTIQYPTSNNPFNSHQTCNHKQLPILG